MGFWSSAVEFFTVPSALTSAERVELQQCVETVRRGFRSFMEAGAALDKIRTRQLYRESHRSFEEFAESEFNLSGRRLHQLIESVRFVESLKTVSPNAPLPTVEAAVRPLAGLSPVDQVEAYQEAVQVAGGQAPTPRQVREAAEKRRATKPGKRLPRPVRFKVPGAIVVVTPNKSFDTVEAALRAALAQLESTKREAA